MENLYFDAFDKYAPALRLLYPNQLQIIADALDVYTDTGQIVRIEDNFARLAFLMIICDDRSQRRKKRSCKAQQKE